MLRLIQGGVFGEAAIAFVVLFIVVASLVVLILRIDRGRRRKSLIRSIRDKSASHAQRVAAQLLRTRERASLDEAVRTARGRLDFILPSAIRRDMRRAGLPGQPVLLIVASGVLAWLIGMFVVAAPIFPYWSQALFAFPAVFLLLRLPALEALIERRRLIMMEQLIGFIEHVQRAVGVGTTPDVAVAEAISEVEEPLASSLDVIKELIDIGYDFTEAINLAAARVNLPEFDIFAASLVAQSTSGGAIGDVLREVADIARMRVNLQKKIATLTGEGRFNALLLGALPIGLSIHIRISQPEYFAHLWTGNILGPVLYFASFAGAIIGAYLAMRLARIKV